MRALILLCLTGSAMAQPLPLPDPIIQLGVCQQMRMNAEFDSEKAQAYMMQFLKEIEELKKQLDELKREKEK